MMLRSNEQLGASITSDKLENITVDAITRIEKELDPYDVVSMVFLLYDVPDVALQRLKVYERVSMRENTNLLSEWGRYTQSRCPWWKFKFLEALTTCRLYSVIRKLGFDDIAVKQRYALDNIETHINPLKKCLYKLCEHTTRETLIKLQNTLKTYDINTTSYSSCELVLLDLMCNNNKFIIIDNLNGELSNKIQIEKFAKIVQNFPELKEFAKELRNLESKSNDDYLEDDEDDIEVRKAFEDIFKCLGEMKIEETESKNLKSDTKHDDNGSCLTKKCLGEIETKERELKNLLDTKHLDNGCYPIKNTRRIGVCYIINQENFHPVKENMPFSGTEGGKIENRSGSTRDKKHLRKTMTSLNFEVMSHDNLDHLQMIEMIRNIIEYRVQHDDSMFILCILSHGVRGHVYAADSVKVKVDDIQNLLDKELQKRALDIPKVMILQACQNNNNEEQGFRLEVDGPQVDSYHLSMSNFLTFWATAPEKVAYRDVNKGSLFIQCLCYVIQNYAKHEQLTDIFTKVIDGVAKICTEIRKDQIPIFKSTLRKKLYLQVPEK